MSLSSSSPRQSCDHYRWRLAEAAGQGFISIQRYPAGRHVIKGILSRGFRRPKVHYSGDGFVQIRGWYGDHRISRTFALNVDGSLPDQRILAGLRETADRMDAKRPGGLKKRRESAPRPELGHPIYVYHNNEQPKLDELVAALPPAGGMAAYLADMSASNDTHSDPVDQVA